MKFGRWIPVLFRNPLVSCSASSILNMEVAVSSEASVLIDTSQCYIPRVFMLTILRT